MDGERFDNLTRTLARGTSRRSVLKGLAGSAVGGLAALLGRSGADAQRVTQAYCGNMVCADDPSVCKDGCVCCSFSNDNNRCMPPNSCERLSGTVICPAGQQTCGDTCIAAGACCTNADCDDGISCTINSCDAGACMTTTEPGFCLIEGACVAQGTSLAGAPCQVCNPALSSTSWSNAENGTDCGGSGVCAGGCQAGACQFPDTSTTCADSTCTDGAQTDYSCDGAGACSGSTPIPCGLYHCSGAGTCHTTCDDSDDCVGTAYCDPTDHTCKGDHDPGGSCTDDDQCLSGFCIDSICCQQNCAAPEHGTATCTDGQTCGFTCATGFKVCDATGTCIPQSDCCGCQDGQECVDGICRCTPTSCPNGCCDAEDMCQTGLEDETCGSGGETCVACEAPEHCGGDGHPGVCAECLPDGPVCADDDCGRTLTDACGSVTQCPDCREDHPQDGYYTWTVPSGVTKATFNAFGARGGYAIEYLSIGGRVALNGEDDQLPGKGGWARAVFTVSEGETYHFFVGGRGGSSNTTPPVGGAGPEAGYNGGGAGGIGKGTDVFAGGGGGGATDVRRNGTALTDRILVAAGGGGAGRDGEGGHGGGHYGEHAGTAGGGTPTAGGAGGTGSGTKGPGQAGGFGFGGAGGGPAFEIDPPPRTDAGAGGGGAGYYGGGGGGVTITDDDPHTEHLEGGGGGSSWVDPSALEITGFLANQRNTWGYLDVRWRYDD